MSPAGKSTAAEPLREALQKYWGYDAFRPLQREAMCSVVEGRDSIVVLPTGGGKSLCFQAPALVMPGLAVVLSPLISLMKDQVDALRDYGVPAACINSSLSLDEKRQVANDIRGGRLKLLYLSPERLMTDRTLEFLQSVPLSFFAIDEAHCISDWGHDFRPEYRMLSRLKELFPNVGVHGYTATATPRVRDDIARELNLQSPEILVGSFDRPNLVYRVQRRSQLISQIREVIERYPQDSGIIYCIRRKDVEEVCGNLLELGFKALPYHAGLDDHVRRRNQEAFINDKAKIIVATVAFGMGIDKSNVRYVIHAAAPKSLEHYQQESGRAGRDGLEAECWLLHTGADFGMWRKIQQDLPEEAYQIAMHILAGIEQFTTGLACRHRAIVNYFGQTFAVENCGACDVCLAEVDLVEDALIVSQKILSCVVRLKENFGGDYTAQVLSGSREQRILDNGHDQLSTWGILKDQGKSEIRDWIEQLCGQGYLEKSGEYNQLKVTPAGRRVLKGEVKPRLMQPQKKPRKESKASRASWDGVDRDLFEVLRNLRREKADERGIPPFIVFGDATLRDMARRRPSTLDGMRQVHGVGEKKCADYGAAFLQAISAYCAEKEVPQDVAASEPAEPARKQEPSSAIRQRAFALFAQGKGAAEVGGLIDRAESTTTDYLVEYIEREGVCDATIWVDAGVFERIRNAIAGCGNEKLKPIFDALNGEASYNDIRIAVACLRNALP